MNLLQLRTKAVELSGRYDLVVDTTDWADNGMDFYINSGMRMLERLVAMHETKARLWWNLLVGDYSWKFQHNCRAVHDVWCSDAEGRWKLEKLTPGEFYAAYASPVSGLTTGAPLHYAVVSLRALETADRGSLAEFLTEAHEAAYDRYDYYGLVFGPPTDGEYTLEVDGLFYNVELSADADQCFWTIQHPDILLRTTLYELESFSRGTEEAKNWLSAITADVFQLNLDVVDEESHGITQLRG